MPSAALEALGQGFSWGYKNQTGDLCSKTDLHVFVSVHLSKTIIDSQIWEQKNPAKKLSAFSSNYT